jgi:hypothetical protein
MIQYGPACTAKPDADAIAIATIEHMAHTMIELEACQRVVTDDMVAAYGDFTSKEIALHGQAARDRAIEIKRQARR